ncbi:S-adenosylmethionine uptake transporter [Aquabacterium commune]|uniref:S-adenosylmethionine uptake transporter n=1 Tax=Aquabacterium commune TaxID=70586 RepID=A0A4R6RHU9_9BURK|nr:DMT family transporter [Aquabacterium commune]TDP85973.1 S-adenosylmethionine uptake transporter [Aquabacterium commune]
MRRSPYWQMALATVLFACMGVCVKLASEHFGTAAVVGMRGFVGAVMMAAIAWGTGTSLRTSVPRLHLQRGLSGVLALSLWFYCIGHLPLATAVTLNYMSSVWMAVFLIGQIAWARHQGRDGRRVDPRLVAAIAVGFAGVALVLHPTLARDQLGAGVVGLVSGMLAAMAYVQVTALGRAGEPEVRVVFHFSLMGTVLGAGLGVVEAWAQGTPHADALADIPAMAWAELIGVGAFATIAQLLMTRAYARGSMLVNASLQYLGIVHASLFGMWLFHEHLGPGSVLGMLLIVGAGMVATRFKPA